jgi:hypothetical protein
MLSLIKDGDEKSSIAKMEKKNYAECDVIWHGYSPNKERK